MHIMHRRSMECTLMFTYIFIIFLDVFNFQHCNLEAGSYTKDLVAINRDLSSIFILDNSPVAYRQYPGKEEQH